MGEIDKGKRHRLDSRRATVASVRRKARVTEDRGNSRSGRLNTSFAEQKRA